MSRSAEFLPNVGHFSPFVEWEGFYYGERRPDCLSTAELLDARAHGIAQKISPYRYDSALSIIEHNLSRLLPDEMIDPGGELEELAQNIQGPLIEIGGPTASYDYPFEGFGGLGAKLNKPALNINLTDLGQESIRADANCLPFKDGCLGLVFASCLPKEARTNLFNEAFRTLEAGGILAYQRGYDLDFYHALSLSFTLKAYSRKPRPGEEFLPHGRMWNFILQKP